MTTTQPAAAMPIAREKGTEVETFANIEIDFVTQDVVFAGGGGVRERVKRLGGEAVGYPLPRSAPPSTPRVHPLVLPAAATLEAVAEVIVIVILIN